MSLDPVNVPLAQEVEAKAVLGRVDSIQQPTSKSDPLSLANSALKNRELNPYSVVLAGLSYLAEPRGSPSTELPDVITDEHEHHLSLQQERRVHIHLAAKVPRKQKCLEERHPLPGRV